MQYNDIEGIPLYNIVLAVEEIKSYDTDYIIPRLCFNVEVSGGKVVDCGVASGETADWIVTDFGDAEEHYQGNIDCEKEPKRFFEFVVIAATPEEDIDESVIKEGKSRCKCDKFSHKEKVAYKKKKNYDKYDEDDDLDEAYEDTFREPNNVQKGTDDWSDFKDDFRQKTLTLKKALTPKFVSGIIKDTDFEVDEKEIKAYAFKVVEEVFGTKEPVENLQSRIRTYFVK